MLKKYIYKEELTKYFGKDWESIDLSTSKHLGSVKRFFQAFELIRSRDAATRYSISSDLDGKTTALICVRDSSTLTVLAEGVADHPDQACELALRALMRCEDPMVKEVVAEIKAKNTNWRKEREMRYQTIKGIKK